MLFGKGKKQGGKSESSFKWSHCHLNTCYLLDIQTLQLSRHFFWPLSWRTSQWRCKMQNANGLITEALHVLFAKCPTCRWRFYTMTSWDHFPNTSHNKKGTATLLPPTCFGGENSSRLYNKQKYFKWSNKERKWFRGFEPQLKTSHLSMQMPAKRRLGLTLPASWAVSLLPHRTHQVHTRATSLGCHTVTQPTSNYQTSSSYNTRIIKQQNFLTMSQSQTSMATIRLSHIALFLSRTNPNI